MRAPELGTVMGRGAGRGLLGGGGSKQDQDWGRFAQKAEVMVWRLGEMAERLGLSDPGSGKGTQPEALLSCPLLLRIHTLVTSLLVPSGSFSV